MRLALALGQANVDAMLAGMSAKQLQEWIEYARLEPFGEQRADLRMGILASVFANVHLPKGRRAMTPRDFMPVFERPTRQPQTWQQMKVVMKMAALAHNASLRSRS